MGLLNRIGVHLAMGHPPAKNGDHASYSTIAIATKFEVVFAIKSDAAVTMPPRADARKGYRVIQKNDPHLLATATGIVAGPFPGALPVPPQGKSSDEHKQ